MRVVLLSVSVGAGHVRCAEALREAAEQGGCEAHHLDLMDVATGLFRSVYGKHYLRFVQRRPALWSFLYHGTDAVPQGGMLARARRALERLNLRGLERRLRDLAPDLVICTHFLPAQIMSRLRAKGLDLPTWVVVTDFDLHAMWVHPDLDGYCAAAVEIAWRMRDRGIAERAIAVTGIPIARAFSRPPGCDECRRELGLALDRPVALLMSGGAGIGALDAMAEALLASDARLQVVALAGYNHELRRRLETLAAAHAGRLIALGFTDRIERAMACADLAVSKPGGLTSAECLAMGLPLVVVSPLPGQEERNADWLLEQGVGVRAYGLTGLTERVRLLLAQPARLAAMRAAALRLARPDAAARVLDAALAGVAPARSA